VTLHAEPRTTVPEPGGPHGASTAPSLGTPLPSTDRGDTGAAPLLEVVRIIRRNAVVLIASVLAALLAGVVVSAAATRTYETETKVLIGPALSTGDGAAGASASDLVAQAAALVKDQAATFAALVETPTVLDPALTSSGVDLSSTELDDDVTAEVVPETSILSITVTAGSATDAAELANGIAASLIERIEEQNLAGSPVGLTGTQVEAPEIPGSPASPSWTINLLVALAIGLVVAFGIIVLRQALGAARPR
jgi:capsular polysaccharide biosynthesis protein